MAQEAWVEDRPPHSEKKAKKEHSSSFCYMLTVSCKDDPAEPLAEVLIHNFKAHKTGSGAHSRMVHWAVMSKTVVQKLALMEPLSLEGDESGSPATSIGNPPLLLGMNTGAASSSAATSSADTSLGQMVVFNKDKAAVQSHVMDRDEAIVFVAFEGQAKAESNMGASKGAFMHAKIMRQSPPHHPLEDVTVVKQAYPDKSAMFADAITMWTSGEYPTKEANAVAMSALEVHSRARSQGALKFAKGMSEAKAISESHGSLPSITFSSSATSSSTSSSSTMPSTVPSSAETLWRQQKLDELLRKDGPDEMKAGEVLKLYFQLASDNARLQAEVETLRAHNAVVDAGRMTRKQSNEKHNEAERRTADLLRERLNEAVAQFKEVSNSFLECTKQQPKAQIVFLSSTARSSNSSVPLDFTGFCNVHAVRVMKEHYEISREHLCIIMANVVATEQEASDEDRATFVRNSRSAETQAWLVEKVTEQTTLMQQTQKHDLITSVHAWTLAKKGDQEQLTKVPLDIDAAVLTIILDVVTNVDGTCLMRASGDDFTATNIDLTESTCSLIINALSQKKEVHVLLHGCNSIRMWTKLESNIAPKVRNSQAIDVAHADVYGCMTTAQFPSGCVPLLTCAYSRALGEGTGLHSCEFLTRDFLKEWATVYEADKQEIDIKGLPDLQDRVAFHKMKFAT